MTTNLADQRFMVPFLPPRHLARPRLDRIVRRWPHRVRLVVAARSGPLLPLHRYRLSGQMAELRAWIVSCGRSRIREQSAGR